MLQIPAHWVLIGMLVVWLPIHLIKWMLIWQGERAERLDGRPRGRGSWIDISIMVALIGVLLVLNVGYPYLGSTIVIAIHVVLIVVGVGSEIYHWSKRQINQPRGESPEDLTNAACLIDLALDEIVVSENATLRRPRADHVIPSAMEQYIRIAGVVPIWPEVDHDGAHFFTLNCGAHVRAAQAAAVATDVRKAYRGRTDPLQICCIYRGRPGQLPLEQAARLRHVEDIEQAMAEVEDRQVEPSWHVLGFERPLSREQKSVVVAEVERFAAWARKHGYRRYCEVVQPRWFEDSAFAWQVFMSPNPESRQAMRGDDEMRKRIKAANIPLVAWNGCRALSEVPG